MTHRVNILNNVDRVIIMQAGMIKEINSSGNINVAQEIIGEESKKADEKLSEGKLIQDEDREVGQVDVEVYKDYLGYSYGYF